MRNRSYLVALCFSALLIDAARVDAQNPPADNGVELGVMFWRPSPVLVLSTTALSGSGIESVDFVKQFGIEEQYFPEFRAAIGWRHKLRVSYVSLNYQADTTIQGAFIFRNRTFTIGAPASADVKWNLWTFGYEWDFLSQERGYLGFVTDFKRNTVAASVDSPLLASAAATNTAATVPTLGAIARVYLVPMLAVTAEFTGVNYNRGFEVELTDFDLYGTLSFGKHLAAQGGYRSLLINYLVNDDSGDLKMKGPYFGAVVRF